MTKWLRPPELEWPRAQRSFDPFVELAQYRLPRAVAQAIWDRIRGDITDATGQFDRDEARRRLHAFAERVIAHGGRFQPDVGRLTRVGVELDSPVPQAMRANWSAPSVPGRQTLVAVELDSPPRQALCSDSVTPSVPGRQTLVAAETRRRAQRAGARSTDSARPGSQQRATTATGEARHGSQRNGPPQAEARSQPASQLASIWSSGAAALTQVAQRHTTTILRREVADVAADADVDLGQPQVDDALDLAGRGEPLPEALRADMEARLGADFRRVRIHTDAVAGRAAQALRARAFTLGHDIFFADGAFAPTSQAGQRLLVHELTHVVQAQQGRVPSGAGLGVSRPSDSLEQEAEAAEDRFAQPEATTNQRPRPNPFAPPARPAPSPRPSSETQASADPATQLDVRSPAPVPLPSDSAGEAQPLSSQRFRGIDSASASQRFRGIAPTTAWTGARSPEHTVTPTDLAAPVHTGTPSAHPASARAQGAAASSSTLLRSPAASPPTKAHRGGVGALSWDSQLINGFMAGFTRNVGKGVTPAFVAKIARDFQNPRSLLLMYAGLQVGFLQGALADLRDNIVGLAQVASWLFWNMSVVGLSIQAAQEAYERITDPEAVAARDKANEQRRQELIECLAQLAVQLAVDPTFLTSLGEDFGEAAGEHVAHLYGVTFADADPLDKGRMVGVGLGYLAVEIALLFLGPETLIAKAPALTAKIVRGGGAAARAILRLLEKIPALRKALAAAGRLGHAAEAVAPEAKLLAHLEKTIVDKVLQQGLSHADLAELAKLDKPTAEKLLRDLPAKDVLSLEKQLGKAKLEALSKDKTAKEIRDIADKLTAEKSAAEKAAADKAAAEKAAADKAAADKTAAATKADKDAQGVARSAAGNAETNAMKKYTFEASEKRAVEAKVREAARAAAEQAYKDAIVAGEAHGKANTAANTAAKDAAERVAKVEAERAAKAAAERAIDGGGVFDGGELDAKTQGRLADFNAGKTGSEAKRLARSLDGLSEQDFLAKMAQEQCTAKTVNIAGPPSQTMRVYEYPDGTVVRYKPLGDAQRPVPTYSIEVKKDASLPDLGKGDAAFKVDSGGKAVSIQALKFRNEVMNAGHKTLR